MKMKDAGSYMIKKWWMKLFVALTIAIVLVLTFSRVYSTKQMEQEVPLHDFTSYLDERIPEIMNTYDIPGTNIALIKEGKVVWTKAYGYADLSEEKKMNLDNYIRVQSISKSITAWGVMKLVEKGKIELDNPVMQYIKGWEFPESQFSEEKITVRQLLCHTGGLYIGDFLTRYSPKNDVPNLRDNLSNEAILFSEPGTTFSYSNVGYNLLELLIEEVTGHDYAEYMKQEILNPLGMNHSSFTWCEDMDANIPFGYNLKGEAIPVYVYSHKASGGLFATVKDIATFVIAELPNFSNMQHILSTESLDEINTPMTNNLGMYSLVFNSYGFGHYIENLSDGKKAIAHGGRVLAG